MAKDMERRYVPHVVELRASNDNPNRIGGYASVFNKPSQDLGGFIEFVDSRAFNKSQGDGWPGVLCRYNHTDLLGTTKAGTLRVSVDKTGLMYEVDLPRSRTDVLELVERGDVTQSSFAFQTFEDDWSMEGDVAIRRLLSVRLIDVAPVDNPAYPDASAGLRSLANKFDADVEEVRQLARDQQLRKFFELSSPLPKSQPEKVVEEPKKESRMTGAQALAILQGKNAAIG